jgi:hypothetical protein
LTQDVFGDASITPAVGASLLLAAKGELCRKDTASMALNFVGCERAQLLLMPPSLAEWLPENHLVWTVLGATSS